MFDEMEAGLGLVTVLSDNNGRLFGVTHVGLDPADHSSVLLDFFVAPVVMHRAEDLMSFTLEQPFLRECPVVISRQHKQDHGKVDTLIKCNFTEQLRGDFWILSHL